MHSEKEITELPRWWGGVRYRYQPVLDQAAIEGSTMAPPQSASADRDSTTRPAGECVGSLLSMPTTRPAGEGVGSLLSMPSIRYRKMVNAVDALTGEVFAVNAQK